MQEEEMERLREELASEGAYHQVSFTYDGDEDTHVGTNVDGGEDNDDDFKLPEKLTVPDHMQIPKTMKEHKLMAKTAAFVAEKGSQIEIVIRLRQSNNPSLSFLSPDSNLNPYYKYLVGLIKSGQYSLTEEMDEKGTDNGEKSGQDEDSDSDEDSGYLHPSLMAKKMANTDFINNTIIPSLLTTSSLSDSYKKLVESLKGHMSSDEEDINVDPVTNTMSIGHVVEAAPLMNERLMSIQQQLSNKPSKFSLLPPPPPEIGTIIERLAERVAKNGTEFELDVRRRADPRFDFLNPGHCYHSFYTKKKLEFIAKKKENDVIKAVEARIEMERSGKVMKPIKFSLPTPFKTKNKDSPVNEIKQEIIPDPGNNVNETSSTKSMDEKQFQCFSSSSSNASESKFSRINVDESLLLHVSSSRSIDEDTNLAISMTRKQIEREKQEERKKKAALFLSLIKGREKKESATVETMNLSNVAQAPLPSASFSAPTIQSDLKGRTNDNRSPREGISDDLRDRKRAEDQRKRCRSKSRDRSRSRSKDRRRESNHHRHRRKTRSRSRSRDRNNR